jgi:prepilin-type N-terminal cleavage/methylation domain-containing protein
MGQPAAPVWTIARSNEMTQTATTKIAPRSLAAAATLSLTPRFSGVSDAGQASNCVNSFHVRRETVETVSVEQSVTYTPLKQGVNEKRTGSLRPAIRALTGWKMNQGVNEKRTGALAAPTLQRLNDSTGALCLTFQVAPSFRTSPPPDASPVTFYDLRFTASLTDSTVPDPNTPAVPRFHGSALPLHAPLPRAERARGATLVEVLTTLAVIGVLSAAAIPVIRSYKPDPLVVASRQLINDLSLARQRAIADHTTVFVVFIPALDNLRPELRNELPGSDLQHLIAGQYVSYALYEKRGAGDQPGTAAPRYLTEWSTLPLGTAIAPQKFGAGVEPAGQAISEGLYPTFDYINSGKIYFNPQNGLYPSGFSSFPTVAFDHQGRLASRWESWHGFDCVIPLTRGRVNLASSSDSLTPVSATFTEDSPGQWRSSKTHVVIDGPTGRARLVRE